MLDEIKSFFDQLRVPFEWPDHFPSIDPISGVDLLAHAEKHHRLAMLALDKTEFHLLQICRAGTDSHLAANFLDQVIAIIRSDESAEQRMRAIGCFLRQRERARASGAGIDRQNRIMPAAVGHGVPAAGHQSRALH